MDTQVAPPVLDRQGKLERLLAEWRAAERELDRLDADAAARFEAEDHVEMARAAYHELADQESH